MQMIFSSYFRNNGIWLRKFTLNTIYSGVTVRTSLWLMDDKNKVLPRWIEPCVYIHKLCSDSLFHIKFLHNAWFHLTLIPIQLDPRLSGWIFQLKKYSSNVYKYWLQFSLLELKHVTWYPEITWEAELLSGPFRVGISAEYLTFKKKNQKHQFVAEWANVVHKVNINIHERENVWKDILQSGKNQMWWC